MLDLKNLLNDKQYEAATSNSKYLRIIAGAGSGKTRVLTYRIAYLIDTLGYYPASILAITFTNKAAEEIKKRVESTLEKQNMHLRIATFHSFCARILREECKIINYPASFSVIDEDDQKKIVKNIMKENDIDDKTLKISSCLDYISSRKNKHISPSDEMNNMKHNYYGLQKARVYDLYQTYLEKQLSMDFDDLIIKTIDIFDKNPLILEKWQNRIKHILVDEFQDVDDNQYLLVKQLAGENNEVTVVGDPDQTIYSWRGANIDIILNFPNDFKGCKTISLEQNYRSSGKILDVANRLIEHNQNRIKKNLFTKEAMGAEIVQFNGENEQKEAEYVVDNINDLYDGKTVFYKDFAILYRTNAQAAPLEQVFMNRGIKYKIYGGMRFYRRMEVKDCIAYLKCATNFSDDLSCERLLENTGKGIGKTTLEKIKANATTEDVSILNHLKNNFDNLTTLYKTKQGKSLQAFVNQMKELHDMFMLEPLNAAKILDDHLHKYGYIDMLIDLEMDDKIENVHQFISQIAAFLKQEGASLGEFIQNVTLLSAQDEIEDNEDYVKLMTIHTAKGLEFENVFVFGLVDQIFPSTRTIQEKVDGIEEERRLFYVAITRAKKRLFLTTSGGYSYIGARLPSRFLREINVVASKEKVTIKTDFAKNNNQNNIHAGSIINHDVFGEGIVISENDGIIDVVFKNANYGRKKLNASHKFIHLVK